MFADQELLEFMKNSKETAEELKHECLSAGRKETAAYWVGVTHTLESLISISEREVSTPPKEIIDWRNERCCATPINENGHCAVCGDKVI